MTTGWREGEGPDKRNKLTFFVGFWVGQGLEVLTEKEEQK